MNEAERENWKRFSQQHWENNWSSLALPTYTVTERDKQYDAQVRQVNGWEDPRDGHTYAKAPKPSKRV